MIQSFVRLLRGMGRQKGFVALNFSGLYVSLTVSVLIAMMIFHERSFDNFHRDAHQIYRVVCDLKSPTGEVENLALAPMPLATTLSNEFPEIEAVTYVRHRDNRLIRLSPERFFAEEDVVFADAAFFQIFNFEVKAGNGQTALSTPNTVLLTESTAARYFPGEPAVGKHFSIENGDKKTEVEVVGIMADPPTNSHLPFVMLVSAASLPPPGPDESSNWGWFNGGSYVYVRVAPQVHIEPLAARLSALSNDRKDKGDESTYTYAFQALSDVHAEQKYGLYGMTYAANFQQFYWLGAIGLFLLLVACINYINLSTAIAMRKAKEVGVRKALGASRGQLAWKFLGETFLLSSVAVLLAAATAELTLPMLNKFLDRQIVAHWYSLQTGGFLTGLCLATTFLAGLYPALVLAGFNPITAFRNRANATHSRWSLLLRRSLVGFQFAVAQVFIVAVIVAALQMDYFQNKPLGFQHQGLVEIRLPEGMAGKQPLLKSRLETIPGVEEMSFSLGAPISKRGGIGTRFNLREKYDASKIEVDVKICDVNYFKTYGLQLVTGRFLEETDEKQCQESIPEDQRKYVCIVNETAVKALGFASPEEALGKEITMGINYISPPIVGVVRDFHTRSLHEKMMPTALIPFHEMKDQLSIRLEPAAANAATISAIGNIWKEIFPGKLFDASFLDEDLAALYRAESRSFSLFQWVALLALLINALGLVGLTAFVVEQKTKEIGVRKVLGASIASVVTLLNKDYLKLILASFVIASPIAYWAMNLWLEDFAYRIAIQWWVFGLAGGLTLLIALLTVSFQSLRAALEDPVKSLKSE